MINIRAQSAGDRSQQQRQKLDLFVLGFDQGLGSGEDGALSQEGKKVQEEWSGIQRVHRGQSAQRTQQMGT